MSDSWPWTYLFTATITELGQTEEWFWDCEPRILISLLRENKRIVFEKMKAMAFLLGSRFEEQIDDRESVAGLDRPADPAALAWMTGG